VTQPRISLALAIHNHQPVGNFGWVFADVYDKAYAPMLEALERHSGIHISLHYTGALLEWLRAEQPEFLHRLRALTESGRVELIGGGYFEPVLASLPDRDRAGQLERMAIEIQTLSGKRPRGAWLAERVWEPDLPWAVAGAGYEWTILDDAHFRAASIAEENLWGAYTTEDQGRLLTVFGTEQGLRYRIPFGEVDDVIAHLRQHATEDGARVGTMGDDGEKFGAWPTTFEHCWGRGRWVDRFFDAVESNAGWLSTVTPSEWLDAHAPIGRVYVPTSSYAEMGEWALPPDESIVFSRVLHDAIERRRPEARWLRGGFWRNFQVKYREINDLHKQMLRTSRSVSAMAAGREREIALDHLYRGQSNDCYWHGLFGGIYLTHMRRATLEQLIAAEDLADAALGATDRAELVDTDLDGRREALLSDSGQVVVVKPDEGAGIGSWDLRAARHAVTAVLRRRPEAYHAKLRAFDERAAETAGSLVADDEAHSGGDGENDAAASIHELVLAKETNLSSLLHYDGYERRSGLVRFLALDETPQSVANAEALELGDFVDGPFEVVDIGPRALVTVREGCVTLDAARLAVRVEKRLELRGERMSPSLALQVTVENQSDAVLDARFGVEFATTMDGGGGNPSAWYEMDGARDRHDGTGVVREATRIGQGNDYLGVAIATSVQPPADAWWAPIETISNSESGFERVYQGSSLLLSWPVRIVAGGRETVLIDNRATLARDAATEETADASSPR
jgi:4-alpha-glucanotransferase